MIVVEDQAPGESAPLSAEELRAISEEISAEFLAALRAEEERVELEAAALDPYRLRVRWQALAAAQRKARTALGDAAESAPLTLRFHALDAGNGAPPYDVFLDDRAGERAFAFRRAGARYRIELGLLRPDGALEPIAPGVCAATPPGAPAPAAELRLRDIRDVLAPAGRARVFEWKLPPAGAAAAAAELAAALRSDSPAPALLGMAAGSGAPAALAPPREAIAWP